MKKINSKKLLSSSIENTSVLRLFTVLFLMMSLIPTIVLYYLYLQIKDEGGVHLTAAQFNFTLILIVLGVIVGYMSMRRVLLKIIDLTHANRRVLENLLAPEKVRELTQEQNEIKILIKSFDAVTGRLEQNVRNLELAKKTLANVMAKVGQGISSLRNIDGFLELILETTASSFEGRTGAFLFIEEDHPGELTVKIVHGVKLDGRSRRSFSIDRNKIFSSVVDGKVPRVVNAMDWGGIDGKDFQTLFSPPMIMAPLVAGDQVKGVITISGNSDRLFSVDELGLLSSLAAQTAIAIENVSSEVHSEDTYFKAISALALAVDARDKFSRGHLERVAGYTQKIGKKLGLDDEDLDALHNAAILHDLGKIGIPEAVFGKKGMLSEEEWILMRRHPEIGESIIKPIRSLRHLCDIIRHHHEKLDGSGYPDGLKGEQIGPLVRILTIADIYDALTSERSFREKMTRKQACDKLRKLTEEIDQEIVEAFIETLYQDDKQASPQ